VLLTEPTEQLDELLGLSIAEFDIPDALHAHVIARYEHVASALADYWPGDAGVIYPQGSIRLGTVTAPIDRQGEYDLDFVCRRELLREAITKRALKLDVGQGLRGYVIAGPDGQPLLEEGGRCWTLEYPQEPFHMDVLPAIPDGGPDASTTAILITDRDEVRWLNSDPIAFADWFHERMREELIQLSEAAKRMEIERAPATRLKTSLQRAVQALKRHRDMHFRGAEKDAPASIIITTLAASAYRPGGSLGEVLLDVSARMPTLVERREGGWWIANPVAEKENFADRWVAHPKRAERFFDWIEQAHADFAGFGSERGIDTVLVKLAESFGEAPARYAREHLGGEVTKMRNRRLLSVAATGALGSAGRVVPQHTFHGDAPTPRHS
jgi:hypothetical protein